MTTAATPYEIAALLGLAATFAAVQCLRLYQGIRSMREFLHSEDSRPALPDDTEDLLSLGTAIEEANESDQANEQRTAYTDWAEGR